MGPTELNRDQTGEGWFSFLYVLVTLGVIGLFTLYSVPVYMTAYSVGDALRGAAEDPKLRGAGYREIHDSVAKRLHTSYVDSVSADGLKIKQVSEGRQLAIAYSVNRHLLFNLGLHYSFNKKAVMPASDDQ